MTSASDTVAAAWVVLLTACGGAPPSIAAPRAGPRIIAASSAGLVTFEAMVDALLEAKVVYVGEHHDRTADHELESAIVEALHARDPSLAVGLEMVQHPQQDALDAYVGGEIDEPAMLERAQWERRWGFDFTFYRPVFDLARRERVPLVALNAPSELTRAVSRRGLDGLEEEERALLPELDLESAAHRAMVEEALREHAEMTPEMLERYYAAQVVWDETMADRVARFLAGDGAPSRMVVLAGVMHVRSGLGIPARAARRGAGPFAVVLPVAESELDEVLREERPVADFLVVTPEP